MLRFRFLIRGEIKCQNSIWCKVKNCQDSIWDWKTLFRPYYPRRRQRPPNAWRHGRMEHAPGNGSDIPTKFECERAWYPKRCLRCRDKTTCSNTLYSARWTAPNWKTRQQRSPTACWCYWKQTRSVLCKYYVEGKMVFLWLLYTKQAAPAPQQRRAPALNICTVSIYYC